MRICRYALNIILKIFTKWTPGYILTSSEYADTQIRGDWVSAYPPIFRGWFKVAGYSAVKPKSLTALSSKSKAKTYPHWISTLLLLATFRESCSFCLNAVGAKLQVTGHRSGYRSQATGQVTGQTTGHRSDHRPQVRSQVRPQVTHKDNRTLDKTVPDWHFIIQK